MEGPDAGEAGARRAAGDDMALEAVGAAKDDLAPGPIGTRGPAGLPSEIGRTWESDVRVTTEQALAALVEGELKVTGRLVEASNATFYCEVRPPWRLPGRVKTLHAVYKPVRGERPLDDFPDGTLASREVAAWHLSQATGWAVVPPTVMRDGPYGPGMLQLWIDVDQEVDVLELILTRDPRLRRFVLFDALANNADRKGGHLLPTSQGALHGCDHGICFAAEPKLRTLLWGWMGEPLTPAEAGVTAVILRALDGQLGALLEPLLARGESAALRARAEALLETGVLPRPDPGRRAIPWPPF